MSGLAQLKDRAMPRVYQVVAEKAGVKLATRFAGTAALAKTARDELKDTLELKKSEVTFEQIEIPAPKEAFLEWLNEFATEFDKPADNEED